MIPSLLRQLVKRKVMPSKRQAVPSTPPSTTKKSKKGKPAQASIDSFFSSPTKPKINGTPKKEREKSVISFVDSDEEPRTVKKVVQGDEELARKLAKEWAKGLPEKVDKGKSRNTTPLPDGELHPDIIAVDTPVSPQGIHCSSSSTHILQPIKVDHPSPEKEIKPIASIFAQPKTPSPETKPESPSTPSNSAAITSTSADPVDAIDFDVDAFLFRPAGVDVSKWPKGRLPYSVLVGVYVQVSSTRSRLTIVRVLTKCAVPSYWP